MGGSCLTWVSREWRSRFGCVCACVSLASVRMLLREHGMMLAFYRMDRLHLVEFQDNFRI